MTATLGAGVDSEQAFPLAAAVVPISLTGARRLGRAYWEEVERTTRGLVTVRPAGGGVELRLLGSGPVVLRFGPPALEADSVSVSCAYPILGGVLARSRGGVLALAQERRGGWRLRTAIRGFSPRLGPRPGRPRWTGFLYAHVQVRLHRAVGRRYAARLVREAPR